MKPLAVQESAGCSLPHTIEWCTDYYLAESNLAVWPYGCQSLINCVYWKRATSECMEEKHINTLHTQHTTHNLFIYLFSFHLLLLLRCCVFLCMFRSCSLLLRKMMAHFKSKYKWRRGTRRVTWFCCLLSLHCCWVVMFLILVPCVFFKSFSPRHDTAPVYNGSSASSVDVLFHGFTVSCVCALHVLTWLSKVQTMLLLVCIKRMMTAFCLFQEWNGQQKSFSRSTYCPFKCAIDRNWSLKLAH